MFTNETTSSSQFYLRKARLFALPTIAKVWTSAFFDDEIIGEIMHPNRKYYPNHVYWFLLRGIRERYWDWRHQFLVACTLENGVEKIVGAADWRRLGRGGDKMELWRWDPSEFGKVCCVL